VSTLRRFELFIGAVVLIAGVVFFVFPIGAIPDETIVGIGAVVGAFVLAARELRRWSSGRTERREAQFSDAHHGKVDALLSGSPQRVREALGGLGNAARTELQKRS